MNEIELKEFPTSGNSCFYCKNGITSDTPFGGGSGRSCPLCEYPSCRGFKGVDYCPVCFIVFSLSHVHGENGCTEDVYYVNLVKNTTINSIKYNNKMPLFKSLEILKNTYHTLELDFECTCNGYAYDCQNAAYVREKEKTTCHQKLI